MAATLASLKDTEERVKIRLSRALNSALVIYFALIMIIALGVLIAQR